MRQRDRNRISALAGTLAFHAALIVALVAGVLRYDPSAAPPEWPPADSSEIIFGDEYVMAGDIPVITAEASQPAANAAESGEAAGIAEVAEPTPQAEVSAPVKATTAKTDAAADRRKAERQAEASRIKDRVTFGKGKSGSPDGSDATGAVTGISTGGLGNRHALELPRPPRGPMGKIVITVKVDRSGRVTAATFLTGEGAAAANAAVRRACIDAARRARFSESADAPVSQTGTLTYNFK